VADKELRGVAGWLLFLVFSLKYLWPLFSIISKNGEVLANESQYPQLVGTGEWAIHKAFLWTFAIMEAGLLFSAGHKLEKWGEPYSVRYAIAILWLTIPLAILGAAAGEWALNRDLWSEFLGHAIATGVAVSFPSAVWTAYLLSSKRVRNTYYGASAIKTRIGLRQRWSAIRQERRKAIFFTVLWIVVVLIWVFVFDEDTTDFFTDYNGYVWSDDYDWGKIWTWALLPPAVVHIFVWAYRKLIASEQTSDGAG
jgi:hypothetical protein